MAFHVGRSTLWPSGACADAVGDLGNVASTESGGQRSAPCGLETVSVPVGLPLPGPAPPTDKRPAPRPETESRVS